MSWRAVLSLSLLGVVVACSTPAAPVDPKNNGAARKTLPKTAAPPSSGGAGDAQASGSTDATHSGSTDATHEESAKKIAAKYFGRVLGLDGLPAAGVNVTAHLLTVSAGQLLSDRTAGLISERAAGLISERAGGVVSNAGGAYHLLQSQEAATGTLSTLTSADGTFSLSLPEGITANVEAQMGDTLKAIRGEITATSAEFDLQLAPTGAIQGRVTVPADSKITDLTGVSVYIPGTSYAARTDTAGNFKIDNVAIGKYILFAEKLGVGEGLSALIDVRSKEVAPSGEFLLKVRPVKVTSVNPRVAMQGSTVAIQGEGFDVSRGGILKIRLNGQVVEQFNASSDTEATFVVPINAKGPLVVEVNGVKSDDTAFDVAANWRAEFPEGFLTVGQTLGVTPVALDLKRKPINAPFLPLYKVVSGNAVEVSASGTIKAVAAGDATIEAVHQGWKAAFPVTVVPAAAEFNARFEGRRDDTLPPLAQTVAGTEGAFYATSRENFQVLSIATNGQMNILAGSGESEVNDQTGSLAKFEEPTGLAFDAVNQRLLVGDFNRIRSVSVPTGVVTTLAGPAFFVSGSTSERDGVGAEVGMNDPTVMTLAPNGLLWFLNGTAETEVLLRTLASDGRVTTLESGHTLEGLCHAPDGTIFGRSADGKIIKIETGSSTPNIGVEFDNLSWPINLLDLHFGTMARDGQGNFYFSSTTTIIKLNRETGKFSTLPSRTSGFHQDGPVDTARFFKIEHLDYDAPQNQLVITESDAIKTLNLENNRVRTVVFKGPPLASESSRKQKYPAVRPL